MSIRLSSAFSMGRAARSKFIFLNQITEAYFVNDNRLSHVPGANKYDPLPEKTSK